MEPTAAADGDFFTGVAAFLEPTAAEDRGWFCSRWRRLYFLHTRSSSSRWRLLHRSSSFLGTNRSRGWRRLHKSNSRGLFGSSSTGLRVLQRGASDNGISFCEQFYQTSSLHQKPQSIVSWQLNHSFNWNRILKGSQRRCRCSCCTTLTTSYNLPLRLPTCKKQRTTSKFCINDQEKRMM